MQNFSVTDLRRKSAEVIAIVKDGETVGLTHNGAVVAHLVPLGQTAPVIPDNEMLALLREIAQNTQRTADALDPTPHEESPEHLIAERAEQELNAQLADVLPDDTVLAFQEPLTVPDTPASITEPSEYEVKTVNQYFHIEDSPDGPIVHDAGIQSSFADVRAQARKDPDSDEAKALALKDGDPDGFRAYLIAHRLAKREAAWQRRANGDPQWLGLATPNR